MEKAKKILKRMKTKEFILGNLIRFLTPEGQQIPFLSQKDTIGYRIEALRLYLEQQLTEKVFLEVYKILQDPPSDEDNSEFLSKVLGGNTKMKFIPLVYQLIVCEDNYYSCL